MAQYVDPTQLTGNFKEAYGDKLINLIPEQAKIIKDTKFVRSDQEEGNFYNQPVVVSNEKGFTYALADAGAFSLKDHIAMATKNAKIQGAQILLRSAIGYDAAAKASNGKKAFVKATRLLVENMVESMRKRLEIDLLYGGTGIGLGVVASSANASATQTVITLTDASWAVGIWIGEEDATLQFYNATSLISSGDDSIFTIVSVDPENKTITVNGTSTGITALDSAISSNPNTLDIYWNGAYGNQMSGIDKIITNTSTLFNINAGTYHLWKGNTHGASSAALTMGKLLAGIAKPVGKGLNESVKAYLSPATWTNLASDLSALRRLDGSWSRMKGENGVENLCYYSQNGAVEIISHNCVKEGEAFVLPTKRVKRVGATDMTFKTPGRENEIFLHLPNNAGFELRNYTNQAILIETPARTLKITGIVNSSS